MWIDISCVNCDGKKCTGCRKPVVKLNGTCCHDWVLFSSRKFGDLSIGYYKCIKCGAFRNY